MKIRNNSAYPKHMQNYNPLSPFVNGDMGVVPFFKGDFVKSPLVNKGGGVKSPLIKGDFLKSPLTKGDLRGLSIP